LPSCEHFETFIEAVGFEGFLSFLVVVRVVGVQPIALRIDIEVGDFRQLRGLNQELLLRDKPRDQVDFAFVEVELTLVEISVHIGVREKDFRCAAFDNDFENVRALEFVERLRGEDHGGVVLAPSLEGLDDIPLNARILKKHPGFIDKEGFENGGDQAVGDDGIGAVQDVEEQGSKISGYWLIR